MPSTLAYTPTSSLTWLDHDAKARERMLSILYHFQETESRDELGLGSVRDSFADQLFPGTSTTWNPLRYMFFVPWIYKHLEAKGTPAKDFEHKLVQWENSLRIRLGDQPRVIGRIAGKELKTWPSSLYWASLGHWGIRLTRFSQDEYHKRLDETYRLRKDLNNLEKQVKARGDDFDVERRRETLSWHPKLPRPKIDFAKIGKAGASWDKKEKQFFSLALTKEEAEFIRERIQSACHGSLLAHLATRPIDIETAYPWGLNGRGGFAKEHLELLEHARLFSEVMHGAALSYNFQLAVLRKEDDRAAKYKDEFKAWANELSLEAINNWSLERLWKLTSVDGHAIPEKMQIFVKNWIGYVKNKPQGLLENEQAKILVREREKSCKGPHSRFENPRALAQWGGKSGANRLTYRWPNVQQLLKDLYQGLIA